MRLLKNIFEYLAKFFASKAGKNTLKAMAGVGVAASGAAAGEMIVAHKRNKRAERIKAVAIKKHDEGRAKVEATLEKLGETKLGIYESFGVLADAIESIQQRPEYKLSIDGIDLPNFKPAEFKQLSMAIEAAVGGGGGIVVGSAVGVATMGTSTILALAPGALLGGIVLCAMGTNMLRRSAEKVQLAKKIEADVENILVYYKGLDKTAKRFHKTFIEIQEPYFKHLRKVQMIVARKTRWEKFSKAEKLATKNVIALAQLLHKMCSVQLVLNAPRADAIEQVNTSVIEHMIVEAKHVCTKVKKGVVI